MANTNPLNDVIGACWEGRRASRGGGEPQTSDLSEQLTLAHAAVAATADRQSDADRLRCEQNTQALTQNTSAKGSSGGPRRQARWEARCESVLGFGSGTESADFGTGELVRRRRREQPDVAAGSLRRAAAGECDGGDQRVECGRGRREHGGWRIAAAAGGIVCFGADADYGAGAGDGQPVVPRSQQRYRAWRCGRRCCNRRR